MQMIQLQSGNIDKQSQVIYIIDSNTSIDTLPLTPEEQAYLSAQISKDINLVVLNRFSQYICVFHLKPKKETYQTAEACRATGVTLLNNLNQQKFASAGIRNYSGFEAAAYHLAEGMALAAYQFLKYRSNAAKLANSLQKLVIDPKSVPAARVKELQTIVEGVYLTRTLVNEPLSFLTAEQLSTEITEAGKQAGFTTKVLNKAAITKLKMGGILAVNRGSILPPTFTIMEYKPKKAVNKQPLVLVGKGIVYDTGGLSLKPTPNSMDRMKSDMSGSALVTGAMYIAAKLNLPVHLIALVPATENRPGENAYVPGDVITMHSGATVEVLNTDAEGRLVLADALHYAKQYNPALVIDFATLTGAAAAATGDVAMVCMGTASEDTKTALRQSGFAQYERMVEFPLWDEYGDLIKSDIADLKNIGGPTGGAITAGKFLEHFTDYPWMHFDIAGVSHTTGRHSYRGNGGTAMGLRMMIDFLKNYK
jgi:leucyl aminopeptidase